MIVKLLTEHHLEFLTLKGGCRDSSESTLVKVSNCWKSRAAAHFSLSISVSQDDVIVIPKTYFKDQGLTAELHAHFNHGFNEKL